MPKSIEAQLEPAALEKAWREWCEQVTDAWLKPRPDSSPEHPSKKGFTREDLIELARVTRLGDDGVRAELTESTNQPGPKMVFIVKCLYREFGYTVGFMNHVREWMADDMGFFMNKTTKIRERADIGGKIIVDARMFRRMRENPFVAAWFSQWCKDKAIAPSNTALGNALEGTGRYTVKDNAPKESTRNPKPLNGR